MKFDDFDALMRKYEESLDQTIPTDCFMVARLDGKGFTKLTKKEMDLNKPFDIRFRNAILKTIFYLMNSDFQIAYAYSESDEISLLFRANADKFARKVRKYNSILAAETSVKFSQEIAQKAVFDCRMIPLPTLDALQDYFVWRQADAQRNAINSHCYYKLLSLGRTPQEAAAELSTKQFKDKTSLLAHYGLTLQTIAPWELYGCGVYWKKITKEGMNPQTQTPVTVERPHLAVAYELPTGEKYKKMIAQIIQNENNSI